MSDKDDFVLESYKDKSNSVQKTTIIFLGIALFFFFMVLIPYYSLRLDGHRISEIDGLLSQARDNISSVNQSLIRQQANNATMIYNSLFLSNPMPKQYEKYESIRTQYFKAVNNTAIYASQLNNATQIKDPNTRNSMLEKLTYKDCKGNVMSPDWFSCNLNHKDKELKESVRFPSSLIAFAPLNNTIEGALNNAIHLQDTLIEKSKNFQLNTSNFDMVKDALKKLNNPKNLSIPLNNSKYLEDIIHSVKTKNFINITISKVLAPLDTVISQINNRTGDFEKRFDEFEAPVVGKIPVGFNEMVAIFPISVAIVFVYLTATLRDLMLLKKKCTKSAKLSDATIWIDPDRPKSEEGWTKIIHSALAWTVLALPAALFFSSVWLISLIWGYVPERDPRFPVFTGAPDINKTIYTILYFFGTISFVLSLLVIYYTTRKKSEEKQS
jgi:hypothetical protein